MSNSSRPLGRRDVLRAGVGAAATAAVAAQPAYAQENESENETAENATEENATEVTETGEGEAAEGEAAENDTEEPAATTGNSVGVLPVFGGILAVSLLSPLIFAVVMKFIYADDSVQETTEHRP